MAPGNVFFHRPDVNGPNLSTSDDPMTTTPAVTESPDVSTDLQLPVNPTVQLPYSTDSRSVSPLSDTPSLTRKWLRPKPSRLREMNLWAPTFT